MPAAPRSNTAVYTRAFLIAHGPPPWTCWFCTDPVLEMGRGGMKGVIHHHDEDPKNNDPDNLVAAHWTCHLSHHLNGRPVSDKARAALEWSGKTHSNASKEKMREVSWKLNPAQRDAFLKDWKTGHFLYRTLADKYGVSTTAVRRMLKHAGNPKKIRRCRKGHELTEDNIYNWRGTTRCLRCHRETALAYFRRNRG